MSNDQNKGDDGFYKGLVYGALIGIGLVWFLNTKEGKRVKKQLSDKGEEYIEKAREKIDSALEDNFVENDQTPPSLNEESKSIPE